MVRSEEAEALTAMKEAKTAKEMVESWAAQRPGWETSAHGVFDLYIERKPEMISTFAQNALTQLAERGILDAKTRSLVLIASYMALEHWDGLLPVCSNAKASGVTEEEMMEVAFAACYAVAKAKLVDTAAALSKIFDNPLYKKVQKRTG